MIQCIIHRAPFEVVELVLSEGNGGNGGRMNSCSGTAGVARALCRGFHNLISNHGHIHMAGLWSIIKAIQPVFQAMVPSSNMNTHTHHRTGFHQQLPTIRIQWHSCT